ncbi:MAG: sigma-70 family RNA polymerase sigma factor [Bacteroidota bacterium]
MLDEKKLIKKCLEKSEAALEELYNRFSARLFGVCLRYARNYQDAEDLLHEGFIRVLDRMKDYRAEGSLEGWMRRVMVTTAINYYHKNWADHYDVELSEVPAEDQMYEDTFSYLSTKELLDHIRQLPDGYRIVFNLYVVEGYRHNEIAGMLSISENTSKSQLMKARNYLMKRIKEDAYEKAI